MIRFLSVAMIFMVACKGRTGSNVKDYSVSADTDTKIGHSYDLVDSTPHNIFCVKPITPEKQEDLPNNTQEFTLHLIEDNKQLVSSFSLQGNVTIAGIFGNAKGEFDWLTNNSVNSYNTYLILRSVHGFTSVSGSDFKFTDIAKANLPTETQKPEEKTKSLRLFRAKCGDTYVKSISRMAYFFGFIKIDTKTAEEKEQIKGALSGKTDNLAVSGSVKIDALRSIAEKSAGKSVEVRVYQGGAGKTTEQEKKSDGKSAGDSIGTIDYVIQAFDKFQGFLKDGKKNDIGVNTLAKLDDYSSAADNTSLELVDLRKRASYVRWKIEIIDRIVLNLLGRKANLQFASNNPNDVSLYGYEDNSNVETLMSNWTPEKKQESINSALETIDATVGKLRDIRRALRDDFEVNPLLYPTRDQESGKDMIIPSGAPAALNSAMTTAQAAEQIKTVRPTFKNQLPGITATENSLFFRAGWNDEPKNKSVQNDFTIGLKVSNLNTDERGKLICNVEITPSDKKDAMGTGQPFIDRFEIMPGEKDVLKYFTRTASFKVQRADLKIECYSIQDPNNRSTYRTYAFFY